MVTETRETNLIAIAGTTVLATGAAFTPRGLALPEDLTEKEWADTGKIIVAIGQATRWAIGDWLNYGERRWGETYVQAVAVTGYAEKSLQNMQWVAGAIDAARRRPELSFEHHAEVAKLRPDQQDDYLQYAIDHGLSKDQLREYIRPKPTTDMTAIAAPPQDYILRAMMTVQEYKNTWLAKLDKGELAKQAKSMRAFQTTLDFLRGEREKQLVSGEDDEPQMRGDDDADDAAPPPRAKKARTARVIDSTARVVDDSTDGVDPDTAYEEEKDAEPTAADMEAAAAYEAELTREPMSDSEPQE